MPNESKAEDWTVWGDVRDPYLVGSEADTKKFIEDNSERDSLHLYLMDPNGNEFEYDSVVGKWKELDE